MRTGKNIKINPFRIGRPIKESTEFIGRVDLVEKILIAMKNLQSISVIGERCIGKTSLLNYLKHKASSELPSNHILVEVDFQSLAKLQGDLIWRNIIKSLGRQIEEKRSSSSETDILGEVKAKLKIASEYPVSKLRNLFQYLLDQGFVVNFLFDNFDAIFSNPHIDSSFFNNLTGLTTGSHNISFIVTTSRDLSDVGQDKAVPSFYNMFSVENLPLFEPDEAYTLLVNAFATAKHDLQLVDKIWLFSEYVRDLTGYHPYLLQSLCGRLYPYIEETSWPASESLYSALVSFAKDAKLLFDKYILTKSEVELLGFLSASSQDNEETDFTNQLLNLEFRNLIIPVNENRNEWQLFSSFFAPTISKKLNSRFIKEYANKVLGKIHRSEKTIHLYTGGKGGTGKTLLSLAATIKYAKNKKVL